MMAPALTVLVCRILVPQVHWRRCRSARLRQRHHMEVATRAAALENARTANVAVPAAMAAPSAPAGPPPAPAERSDPPEPTTPSATAARLRREALAIAPVEVEAPTSSWTLAVRIVRAQRVLVPRASLETADGTMAAAGGARLYVYYSLFGSSSGVATSVHGETRHVLLEPLRDSQGDAAHGDDVLEGSAGNGVDDDKVACTARFDFEHFATLRTTLGDEAFRSYLQAESARLELWLAPDATSTSPFSHTLLGTSTASLCGAESGVQITCGLQGCPKMVQPRGPHLLEAGEDLNGSTSHAGELRVAFCVGRGRCDVPLDLPPVALSSPAALAASTADADAADPTLGASGIAAAATSQSSLDGSFPRFPEHTPPRELPPHDEPIAAAKAVAAAAVAAARRPLFGVSGALQVAAVAADTLATLGREHVLDQAPRSDDARVAEGGAPFGTDELAGMISDDDDGDGELPSLSSLSGCLEELEHVNARLQARLAGGDYGGGVSAGGEGAAEEGAGREVEAAAGGTDAPRTGFAQAERSSAPADSSRGGAAIDAGAAAHPQTGMPYHASEPSPREGPADGSSETVVHGPLTEEWPNAAEDAASVGTISPWISPAPSVHASPPASPRAPGFRMGSPPPPTSPLPPAQTATPGRSPLLASPFANLPASISAPSSTSKPNGLSRLDAILASVHTAKAMGPRNVGRIARILNGRHGRHGRQLDDSDDDSDEGEQAMRQTVSTAGIQREEAGEAGAVSASVPMLV